MKRLIKRSWHWIALFLVTDAVFIFATWIIRREAIRYMSQFLLMFTAIALAAGLFAEFCRQRKDEAVLLDFLSLSNDQTKEELLQRFRGSEAFSMFCAQFLSELSLVNEKTVELTQYREYIEAWVHEAKTPLSLSTLVLENHRDEMSPYVYTRLNYIQHQLNEDVERILYYARLQAEHSDIKFTRFSLDECVKEVVSEYSTFTEERNIFVTCRLQHFEVISDRKIVLFMLSQLIGNAVKYADGSRGEIAVSTGQEGDKIYLGIYNNGDSVPPEDAPFIFDKGFTGSNPNRQKATGMGLYLVRKYAEKLCVEVRLDTGIPYDCGFGIVLIFTL